MDRLISFTSSQWNDHGIQIKYKRSILLLDMDKLEEHNQKKLKEHDCTYFHIEGKARVKGRNIDPSSIRFIFHKHGIPVKLKDYEVERTHYIKYRYWDMYRDQMQFFNIQQNGFLVYSAPTGQGKTYFALNNLELLASQVDTVLYVNFELSIEDIKNRCEEMELDIPDNVYIAPVESVETIKDWASDKGRCVFIIDNIDNLVGGGQDAYSVQLEYIKELDRFLKDYNHHALVLTQIVKEGSKSDFFDKDGDIHGGINTNILSGVKQLAYLSRTVMMTAFSPEKNMYVYKFLKVGSAKK